MKIFYTFALSVVIIAFVSCSESQEESGEETSAYAKESLWYGDHGKVDTTKSDVFYILPTCISDYKDSSGIVQHFANPEDSSQRAAFEYSFSLGKSIFGHHRNYFSPYYRQISMESWESDSTLNARWPTAEKDLYEAFDYYIQNQNGGRPFILAGFSQGAKGVVQIIKHMSPEILNRMIAAYVIGYKVTAEDTAESKNFHLATDESTPNTVVAINSIANIEEPGNAIVSRLSEGNIALINPVNWKTDESSAPLSDSVTVPFWVATAHNSDTLSVHLDTALQVLIVEGMSPERYQTNSLFKLFPTGNLHLQDPHLYQEYLKKNADVREKAWRELH